MAKLNAFVIGAAMRYTAHVAKMLQTADREVLAWMEEDRQGLHTEFLDALKKSKFKLTRSESEDLAWKIRNESIE